MMFFFIAIESFSTSLKEELFQLENDSSYEIMFTIKTIDPAHGRLIDYYKQGVFIDKIELKSSYSIDKYHVPVKETESLFYVYRNDNISVIEKFFVIVKDFIIYDRDGNIILTLDDIYEELFYSLGTMNILHIIRITDEVIEFGRRKYSERRLPYD